jgi:hypothetical protein
VMAGSGRAATVEGEEEGFESCPEESGEER